MENRMRLSRPWLWIALAGAAGLLFACASSNSPAAAIQGYLQAIVAKDEIAAANLACSDWEAQARAEALSFDAVEVRLDGVACQSSESSADSAVVTCQGKILANYGAEDQEIDLAGRGYQAVRQNGRWLMCGYQ
jgi:hypothetical protein